MAAPRVNHHAEKPKLKANSAVPMVELPPTRVPMMVPATMMAPALPPPVSKSATPLTFRPE